MAISFSVPTGYPRMLLAIDPGSTTGFAVFESPLDGAPRLTRCGWLRHSLSEYAAPPAVPDRGLEVVVEMPKHRRGEKNPDAMYKLAAKAGYWLGAYQGEAKRARAISPNDWKGTTPKRISHPRIKAKLTPFELAILERALDAVSKTDGENIIDAVGIGLFAVGRKA